MPSQAISLLALAFAVASLAKDQEPIVEGVMFAIVSVLVLAALVAGFATGGPLADLSEKGLAVKARTLGYRACIDVATAGDDANKLERYRREAAPGLLEVFDEMINRGFAEPDQRAQVENPQTVGEAQEAAAWIRDFGDKFSG